MFWSGWSRFFLWFSVHPFSFPCLSDSKSLQVSRTLLSILVDLNAVIRMVSILHLTSNSSRFWELFEAHELELVSSSVRCPLVFVYLFAFFIFIMWSTATAKSISLVFWSGLGNPLVSQNPREFSYYYYSFESFSHLRWPIVSHSSLSNNKFPQVSRTLLRILVNIDKTVVSIVSTRPLISKSSSRWVNPLVTVSKAPVTIGITVTFMYNIFVSSQARSGYLSFFSLFFNFTLWSAGTAKFTILHILFFFFL